MINELHAGSFRGAVFYVTSASTAGGRKQVKHEYPYADRQKIEDLGFKPRNLKLSAIIPAETPDDPRGYIQKRDELLAALERGGFGVLSHPFFSNTMYVVARPYTLTEDMATLGVGRIELEFDYSSDETNPQPEKNSLPKIQQLSQKLVDQVGTDVAARFKASFPITFDAARAKLTSVVGAFQTGTSIYNQVTSEISSYGRLISEFSSDITQLIQAPATLGSRIVGLISPVTSLYSRPETTLSVSRSFFSFGDDDPVIMPTTISRIQQSTNNAVLTNAVHIGALASAYQVIGEIDFQTVDDVQTTQNQLEVEYQKIVDAGQTSEASIVMLIELRTQVNDYLEQAKLTAPEVVDVTTKEIPLSVLAFDYYGYDDELDLRIDQLVHVNSATDLTFTSGVVGIVTNG